MPNMNSHPIGGLTVENRQFNLAKMIGFSIIAGRNHSSPIRVQRLQCTLFATLLLSLRCICVRCNLWFGVIHFNQTIWPFHGSILRINYSFVAHWRCAVCTNNAYNFSARNYHYRPQKSIAIHLIKRRKKRNTRKWRTQNNSNWK